jgi:4-amino-4-deoxy-L-arabinose transferase-like glycosyltransferase
MKQMSITLKRPLVAIMVVALLLRLVSVAVMGNSVEPLPGIFDQISYHNLALRLLDGHGFSFGEPWWPATAADAPTAHWSYLYTVYLAAVYAIFGPHPWVARLLQAVAVSFLMPWLVYRLSRRLFGSNSAPGSQSDANRLTSGHKVGLVAAAIIAVYVYFFYYAAALITESFYIVAILWIFDLAIVISQTKTTSLRHWLLLGVALGVAVLLRQLFLLFIPLLLFWLWWVARPRLPYFLVSLTVLILMMLPWTIRNYLAFDRFVILNTNAGYAFYWGNHPIYGTSFIPILPNYYSLLPPELLELDEAALDTALLKRGIEFILNDPVRYLQLSLSRIPHYFVFWPSAESSLLSNLSRVASFGLFLPFMLYGLIRTLRYRYPSLAARIASPFFLIYLFIVVYTGIHVLTWTLIRYRLPIDAFLIIFAGLAVVELGERLNVWRGHPRAAAVS